MKFQDPMDCYQALAAELEQIIVEPWKQIDVETKLIGESSINTKVTYIKHDGGKGSSVDFVMLPRYFFDLARLVSTEEKGLYKECNFSLRDNGSFDVDFKY